MNYAHNNLSATVQFGEVGEIDPKSHKVKVIFNALGGMISDWLPVITMGAGGNQFYALPDVGATAVCLMNAGGDGGVVLGVIYNDQDMPPTTDGQMWIKRFSNDTIISHNRQTGQVVVEQLGVIVGRSGTGKTSIGKQIWQGVDIYNPTWQADKPIIDQIAVGDSIDKAIACLSAVGLGTVPVWLRPFHVLSNSEQFRANLAKALADEPNRLIIDEFSSVVDRQIACIGASAFAKAWKRTKGKQAILLTCHYDVLDWLEPDWVYNTDTGNLLSIGGLLGTESGNAHPLPLTFTKPTGSFGQLLSHIII